MTVPTHHHVLCSVPGFLSIILTQNLIAAYKLLGFITFGAL